MMAAENGRGWDAATLQAYCDGELGAWARWRFERRLERSPELRRELAALAALGDLVRESEAAVAAPDLWEEIARRLPAVDAERAEAAWAGRRPGLLKWYLKPVGAVVAVGAVAVALAFALLTGETAPSGVVHWVDGGDRNVMVLDGEGDVTVIWVFDSVTEGASRGGWRASA
jgi:anti-sigma-K factor RskA